MAVFVDLEVEVAADGAGVAGLAHRANPLTRPDTVAAINGGRAGQVGVEVGTLLTLAVEQQIVAVEDRVVAGAPHAAGCSGHQRGAARGNDVEAFVDATAAAGCAEFTDIAAGPVRAVDRGNVVAEESASA